MIYIQRLLPVIYILLHINKVRSQCSSTQSVSASYESGVIESPGYNTGYNQNLVCSWSISTSLSGASIIYQIMDIWISCSGDKVVTYDGTSQTATKIDDLCSSSGGGAKGNIRIPSSGNIFLRFTTDANTDSTEKGFQFYYTAAKDFSGTGCSGTQSLTASSTDSYISSPGFPSKYQTSQTCNWIITATDSSEHVYIEIIFIDIENDANCQYDYLRIQDGTTNTKLCVTVWNYGTTYTSNGNSFNLTFYSDNAETRQGFMLKHRQTQTSTSPSSIKESTLASSITTDIETTEKETSPEIFETSTINAATTSSPSTTSYTVAMTTTPFEKETTEKEISTDVTVTSTINAAETTTQTPEITSLAITSGDDIETTVTSTIDITTADTTTKMLVTTASSATTRVEANTTADTTTQMLVTTASSATTRVEANTTEITTTTTVTDVTTSSSVVTSTTSVTESPTKNINLNAFAVTLSKDESLTSTLLTETFSDVESTFQFNESTGSSLTTTTSATTNGTDEAVAPSTASCDSTTCVLPAVLGSVIGTGVLSAGGLVVAMKAKGYFAKYTPGQNKVNVEKGNAREYGNKKDKNEIDKNENVQGNNPDESLHYITEKTAIVIDIVQPIGNG